MSRSAFLDPDAPPAPAGHPRRRWLLAGGLALICLGAGAGPAWYHAALGHGPRIQRPGPRRYPPPYRHPAAPAGQPAPME